MGCNAVLFSIQRDSKSGRLYSFIQETNFIYSDNRLESQGSKSSEWKHNLIINLT